MKLLTRYTLRTFVRYLMLTTATFTSLYLLVDFLDKVDDFVENHAAGDLYFSYLAALFPGALTQMMPLATLLAVFLTIGGFNRTTELTAMMAGGVGIWRIVLPLCLAGMLISGAVLLSNEFVVPWATRSANHILRAEVKGKAELFTTRGKIWFKRENNYINAKFFNAQEQLLQSVRVFQFDDNSRLIRRIDAKSANYLDAEQTWLLQECTIYRYANNGKNISHFDELDKLTFDLGKSVTDLKNVEPKPEEMTYQQLREFVARLQAEGFAPGRHRVAMYQHLATPFASFVMVLLGIPFALKRGRNSGMGIGIAISVAVAVTYIVVDATAAALGTTGKVPPFLTVWIANLSFIVLAVILMFRRRI